ncbi:hypothetical protein GGR54DRAFT_642488 [Hypoxylon sp. NC1633]|nr:hypothetical protein GGR54DRAFT_642488 [Hypoxylon sp. NC1633]
MSRKARIRTEDEYLNQDGSSSKVPRSERRSAIWPAHTLAPMDKAPPPRRPGITAYSSKGMLPSDLEWGELVTSHVARVQYYSQENVRLRHETKRLRQQAIHLRRGQALQKGDLVMVLQEGKQPKLTSKWRGPFLIWVLGRAPHTYSSFGDVGFGEWPVQKGQLGPALPSLLGYHPEWGTLTQLRKWASVNNYEGLDQWPEQIPSIMRQINN